VQLSLNCLMLLYIFVHMTGSIDKLTTGIMNGGGLSHPYRLPHIIVCKKALISCNCTGKKQNRRQKDFFSMRLSLEVVWEGLNVTIHQSLP